MLPVMFALSSIIIFNYAANTVAPRFTFILDLNAILLT